MSATAVLLIATLCAQAPSATPPRCSITGRVVDCEGLPIGGATVQLSAVDEPWRADVPAGVLEAEIPGGHVARTTGADGRFAFDLPVPTASWVSLYVKGSEYHGISGRDFGVAGGRNRDPLRPGANDLGDIALAATGALSGIVLDGAGRPLAGATVRLDGASPGGYSVGTGTGEDGRYRLGHAPEGEYRVECLLDGYRSAHRSAIAVRNGATTPGVDFALEAAQTISGTVADVAGKPLAGVRVWGWPTASGQGAGSHTGADGRFTIALPQDDPYVLEAHLQGYESYEEARGWEGHPPATRDVRIVLKSLQQLRFLVVDAASGAPIEDFGLVFEEALAPNRAEAQNANHPDLRSYHFANGATEWWATPGRHDYLIQAAGYAPQRGPVRLDPGSADQQTIRLVRGGSAQGTLAFGERPAAGAIVHLDRWPRDAMDSFTGRRRSAVADALGRFEFADLASGSYRIEVRADGAAPATFERFDLYAPEALDLGVLRLDPAAAIAGTVLVDGGKSREGILISLGRWIDDVVQRTDREGRFRFDGVAVGTHELTAGTEDEIKRYARKPVAVTTRAGETAEVVIDLRTPAALPPPPRAPVPRARNVEVRVTLDGKPGIGLTVTLSPAAERWIRPGRTLTDRLGTELFESVAPGAYLLDAWSPAGVPLGRRALDVPASEVTLRTDLALESGALVVLLPEGTTVPRGARVIITATEECPPDGRQAANGDVRVCNELGQVHVPTTWREIRWTATRYELGAIGAGRWIVEVGGDVLRYRKVVAVEAGKTAECRMTLADAL